MKKIIKPEIEFVEFDKEDIITTSGEDTPALLGQFNFAPNDETKPDDNSPANDKGYIGFAFNITG